MAETDRLLISYARTCSEILAAYQTACVQRVYLWFVEDELEQRRIVRDQIGHAVADPMVDGLMVMCDVGSYAQTIYKMM